LNYWGEHLTRNSINTKKTKERLITNIVEDEKLKSDSFEPLEKIPTGIKGLDEILHGGLPKNRATLILGGPGTGKTIFGLESLYLNATSDNPGLFVSFEEDKKSVVTNAQTFGWDLNQLEQKKRLAVIDGTLSPGSIISGKFDLKGFLSIIDGQKKSIDARLIVIDSIDVIIKLLDHPVHEQHQFHMLHTWLKNNNLTSIITMKNKINTSKPNDYSFLEYMMDCVIHLDQRIFEQVNTRRIRVVKYRGSSFGSNEYPYIIGTNGVTIIPITDVNLQYTLTDNLFSIGNKNLDSVLGGGIRKDSTILVSGKSGTGKTTLLSTFALDACRRGERVLFISFEESNQSLITFMKSSGINFQPIIQSNHLHIESIMPESTGSEEHLVHIFQLIKSFQPDHIILETISACKRMGSSQTAFDFIMRFIHECKKLGITCFISNQLSNTLEEQEISNIGISSIIDTLILLKYVQINGRINRVLLVEKSRGMNHSHFFWRFTISDNGIYINEKVNINDDFPIGVIHQDKHHFKNKESLSYGANKDKRDYTELSNEKIKKNSKKLKEQD
jgi:circadian clock protein KaiC